MADKSAIEWTEASWNPVTGCSKVSPGCAHCYAETLSLRFGWSKKPWAPEHAAENVVLHPERLEQPLRWRRPRMIFVNSMSDLFHEEVFRDGPDFAARIFAVMSIAERHTFQVLTKRPEIAQMVLADPLFWLAVNANRLRYGMPVFSGAVGPRVLDNVWLGVSIENARHTWRADVLREIPAAVRFISAEPLLASLFPSPNHSPVEAREAPDGAGEVDARDGMGGALPGRADTAGRAPLDLAEIDWVICGGESGGRQARPMRVEWARELRDACLDAQLLRDPNGLDDRGPAFFFKQWGSWAPVIGHLNDQRNLFVVDGQGPPEPWHGSKHGAITSYGEIARDGRDNPIYRFTGASSKSGGRVLEGREWNEMPRRRDAVPSA